ncbi:T9SS type A sorting domain-containing protein [Seonamhaeicola sediminis]|uniref:glucan endo-1,3-beta-D-glucosidase n=1 Tax=Seonamhaeicola sediminis TaxID=2528206 RepID=A0A562YGZ8_9FLAO|nr:glycosyl hydrolase [Seonamhaeicola sediminis]TWO34041.1 T9SS type A sorting domain-containing protein [Seonamhaeicola sediminis]
MKAPISSLVFVLLFIIAITAHSQVAVGNGSYTTTFPGTDSAGRNGFPSGTPFISGTASGKPVPTNDWWSALIKNGSADNLFNYPMTMKTVNQGVVVTYIPWGVIDDQQPIIVGVQGLNASQTTVSDYSDWTVTMDWSSKFKATSGIGMPFIYFEKENTEVASITINLGTVNVSGEMITVTDARNGGDFAIYAPVGSTWTQNGNTYTSTLNGNNYWSMAMIPLTASNVNTVANEYKKYAYVFPTNTEVAWSFNESTSKVTTVFNTAVDVKDGSVVNTNILQGLLPHQWDNLASGSPVPNGYTYDSVRGDLKTLVGNSFTVENTFKGILPTLPYLANYSDSFSPADLQTKISQIENDALATWTDSYNEGQVMNRLIQTARIADQMGNTVARDKMVATIKERLEDWLTYQSGEVAFLFYYNSNWSAMLGYPAGHGQDNNINDHHFHWGYFIHAAAFMEQFEPGWADQWGDMVNLLVRDAASSNRSDTQFPFLRNFSPYAGHCWANGFASFPQGNDQESTSESMQFNSSLIHWGSITGNDTIRDLGIYLYTTEQTAVEEYWLDMNERIFPTSQYSLVSRVWGNSYDNGTFWTSDIAASYGIELYPMHGGSLYLGQNTAYVQKIWNELKAFTGILNPNDTNPNLWHDTIWKYLSFLDPAEAISLYNADPDRVLKFGVSDAQTYHWLHAMNAMGQLDATITANHPIAAVFNDAGDKTYVGHNYSDTPIIITFSDGFMLDVPANSMATNKDVNVSGTITSNISEGDENDSAILTVTTTGGNITKVEFYNGNTLLGEDTTTPYNMNTGTLPFGIHNVYAKVYAGTNFNVTNIVSIQIGSQVPYSGTASTIPGTIEAGHYDVYEGGNGQNIAYFDGSIDNQGGFRPTEYVDAKSVAGEGDTVGWLSGGEWMEYTVNVATTGCYNLSIRYTSGNTSGGGPIYFEVDGIKISSDIAFAYTGDWNNWSSKATTIDLTAGIHVLRLGVSNGEVNIGRMTFSYNSNVCEPPVENTGLPFDFETTPVTADFEDFDGGTGTVEAVSGPRTIGNSSANLAKIVRNGGAVWAGSKLTLNEPLNFSTKGYITLKIWTDAPIGTTVKMKLEQGSPAVSAYDLDRVTTKTGEWETLSWNFSGLGITAFDRLAFMFDFGNLGDGTATSTFYFDDVQHVATLSSQKFEKQQFKVFPNPTQYSWTVKTQNANIKSIKVFDVLGKNVMSLKPNKNEASINASQLISGLYFAQISTDSGTSSIKLIKQ